MMNDIEEIYKKYANSIRNYIFCITKNFSLAEDIMQETFVVAINQINKFRGDCEISVWLCSIAKKILYKKTYGNIQNNLQSIDDLKIADKNNVEECIIYNDNKLKIFEAIQKLDNSTREVIYLRLAGDLTFKEIGKILNKSENWARVTYYRGKQKIKKEDII